MFSIFSTVRYSIFGRSPKWTSVRKEHLYKNPNCAACGRNKKVEVHHIKPFHKAPNLELDPDNLITLCADPCHIVFGHFQNWKNSNPDVIEMCQNYFSKLKESQLNGM